MSEYTKELEDLIGRLKAEVKSLKCDNNHERTIYEMCNVNLKQALFDLTAARAEIVKLREALAKIADAREPGNGENAMRFMADHAAESIARTSADYAHLTVIEKDRLSQIETALLKVTGSLSTGNPRRCLCK